MLCRRTRVLICLLGMLAPLAACQMFGPQVPDDARLLYFGPVEKSEQISSILPMDVSEVPRQIYIYDDTAGKVVAVRTVDGHHRDLNFSWIPGHQYRVYFE
jgi:hypothetical protein